MRIEDHPTVKRYRERAPAPEARARLDAVWLRTLALELGADDVGFVELDRPALASEKASIQEHFPHARSLISLVVRMGKEPIRTPARSIANLEFHHTGDEVNGISRALVSALEERGVRALNPSMGFPMEMDRWPGRLWVVSHKPVAVEAGLGRVGIHRNVIHPRFGNFILLGTVITDAEISSYGRPIDYNPCLECKLCVAACPVGAIGSDGSFDFSSCYTHNYREFMGGFTDWAEQVADAKDARDYRRRVPDKESVSLWQSLSFGPNYKAAYCLSVCPAGDEVIGPWLEDRKGHLETVVKPLQEKREPIYVLSGSDAEEHVAKRFPHKTARRVGNGLRPLSIRGFLDGIGWTFQRGKAAGLDATYHFTFTGEEPAEATVVIRDKKISVRTGHHGRADVRLRADSSTWIRFLAREVGMFGSVLRGTIRFRGSPRLLLAFQRCFPA